jgi:polyhydroxyalkanoate synthesis regulator phasin
MIDNTIHRALFSLPPIQLSAETALAVPELPPQRLVTGDKEVDAVIWLREVIGTGQPALIAKAKKAAKKIKTPLKELEKRYSDYLARTSGRNLFATFGAVGFADLDGWEETSIKFAARRQEAHARFGDQLFHNTAAETFSEEALVGVKQGRDEWDLDKTAVETRFDERINQRPATLSDCLAELKFWTDLYWLRNAVDRDCAESGVQAHARKDYAFRCLGRILPRSTEEAHQVLQYLIDDGAMDWPESRGILMNLMTQISASAIAEHREHELAEDPITGEMEIMPNSLAALHAELLQKGDRVSIEAAAQIRHLRREMSGLEIQLAEVATLTVPPASGFGLSDRPNLQSLRDELHPSLLPLYPALLTKVTPPTVRDVIDVLEQLDAISCVTGVVNTAQFAMEVINGLMSIVDLGRVEPGDPRRPCNDANDEQLVDGESHL